MTLNSRIMKKETSSDVFLKCVQIQANTFFLSNQIAARTFDTK